MSRRLHTLAPAAALAVAVLLAAGPAFADDAKCINALNANAAKVAEVQGGEVRKCVKDADKAGAPGAEACADGDTRGKVAKAIAKAVAGDVGGSKDKCDGMAPAFLYVGTPEATDAARGASLDLAHDLFGPDLDTSVVAAGAKDERSCRDTVLASTNAVLDASLSQFNACKKQALKGGLNTTDGILPLCFRPGADALLDPKEKIDKAGEKLAKNASKKCTGLDTDALFPGRCVGATGPAFVECTAERAACRTCLALIGMDGITIDCDLFDDGEDDESCSLCGNGSLDGEEACDDGNLAAGDGCSALCEIEPCGNGTIEAGEECDDGNLDPEDGCSATCEIEGTAALVFTNPCRGGTTLADDAAMALGLAPNVIEDDFGAFNTAFDAGGFDVVVFDSFCSGIDGGTQTRLETWASGGGRLLVAYWDLDGQASLQAALGITAVDYFEPFRPVYADPASPVDVFALRQSFPSPLDGTDTLQGFDVGDELTLTGAGFLTARLDSAAGPGALAVTNAGRSVTLGFTPELLGANDDGPVVDGDADTVPDMQELWENLLALVFSN